VLLVILDFNTRVVLHGFSDLLLICNLLYTMELSQALLTQVDRYAKQGTWSLTQELKHELRDYWQSKTSEKLNIHCGTCLGKALASVKRSEAKPKIHFVGVKEYTLHELREKCDKLGIQYSKFHSKEKLKQLLNV
jgi:hypothetical protein